MALISNPLKTRAHTHTQSLSIKDRQVRSDIYHFISNSTLDSHFSPPACTTAIQFHEEDKYRYRIFHNQPLIPHPPLPHLWWQAGFYGCNQPTNLFLFSSILHWMCVGMRNTRTHITFKISFVNPVRWQLPNTKN